MLIIVIEKAISDPPFNSASVLLSGRLRVCAAKETFPFPCVPVSLGYKKTGGGTRCFITSSRYEWLKSRQGEYRGVIFRGLSGIRFSAITSYHHSHHSSRSFAPFIFFVITLPPSGLQCFRDSLKTGTCHKIKQTHN